MKNSTKIFQLIRVSVRRLSHRSGPYTAPMTETTTNSGANGLGELGVGAGKGGGWGGSIREAGGALGRMGAAKEEEYFHRKQVEQIEFLKRRLLDENRVHQQTISRLQQSIEQNEKAICQIEESYDKK